MVTSLLFGETCSLLESKGEWLHISCDHDGYKGWVPESYLAVYPENRPVWTKRLDVHGAMWQNVDSRIDLSPGSLLPDVDETHIFGHHFKFSDSRAFIPETKDACSLAMLFLFTPYLWGGRSVWGIDCSGLTQVVYSMLGKSLPRDARDQEKLGTEVDFEHLLPGDLAFFHKEGNVTHVGIVLPGDEIIHASGRVKVDKLTPEGIINQDNNQLSHTLYSIRRIS